MTSNTARLAALTLTNCRIIDYDNGSTANIDELSDGCTWLLYPGPKPVPAGPMPRRLVILDASFRRAKRMYHRIASLRELPELALDPPRSAPLRLRQPPRPDGMSTIEAIAAGLSFVEEASIGPRLLEVYEDFVRRADAAHGRIRANMRRSAASDP